MQLSGLVPDYGWAASRGDEPLAMHSRRVLEWHERRKRLWQHEFGELSVVSVIDWDLEVFDG